MGRPPLYLQSKPNAGKDTQQHMTSIRVIDYNGDFDTLNEVFLIGPFASEEEATAEADRLDGIADPGGYEFEVGNLSSDDMADPQIFAAATDAESFDEALGRAFHGL